MGSILVAVIRLLIAKASLVPEHNSRCVGIVVAACGLSSFLLIF